MSNFTMRAEFNFLDQNTVEAVVEFPGDLVSKVRFDPEICTLGILLELAAFPFTECARSAVNRLLKKGSEEKL